MRQQIPASHLLPKMMIFQFDLLILYALFRYFPLGRRIARRNAFPLHINNTAARMIDRFRRQDFDDALRANYGFCSREAPITTDRRAFDVKPASARMAARRHDGALTARSLILSCSARLISAITTPPRYGHL